MRRTKLRTKKTADIYDNSLKSSSFIEKSATLREFKYWRVIANDFPYDAVATTHDLLVPKRKFAEIVEATKEEKEELDNLIKEYLCETYDMYLVNFNKGRTVQDHYHIHLLNLIIE